MGKSSKIAIPVLSILLVAAVSWAIYSYLLAHSLNKTLARLNIVEEVNQPLEIQVVKQQILLDSLNNELDKQKVAIEFYNTFSDSAKGVYFEIQLGMFSQFELNAYVKNLYRLRQENKENMNLILLGRFTSLSDAEEALKKIKELGLKTAFITGRIDGRIVSKEVAEAALL